MDLSIIIVSYNTKNLTLKAIKSVFASVPASKFEVIVVDNNSDDGSQSAVKKSFPKVTLIQSKQNLGFAKANNLGIKKSKGEFILLLNSDTEVKKASINNLLEFARRHPDAGAVVPKLLNTDGTVQASAFRFPGIWKATRQYWLGEKGILDKFVPKWEKEVTVDAAVMAAFLITPQARKKAGLLNEKYFMYFEDIDYCRKLKHANLKLYYVPEAEVLHHHGASGKSLPQTDNWKRLIPGSKLYHGVLKHYLITAITWTGQRFGQLVPIALLVLLISPSFLGLLRPGYFTMQDDLQAFRIHQMDRCFDDLQLPCRWVPDAGYQYGYPQFNYYPPLPYYIGALLYRAGIQYIDSVKILFIAGYILSAFTMYLLISSLTNRWSGLIGAILYTLIPYKAVEVYVRGALNEFWAQIFFPLILWAIYQLVKTGKQKYILWLSLSLFALATTHTLMTMIFAPIAALWAVFWLIKYKGNNFPKLIIGGILGFSLAAFFILPVIFERKFAHVESLLSGYFDYRQHFVNLRKLFLSMEWGYGSSGFPAEKLNLSLGIVHWIVGLIMAPILAIMSFKRNKIASLLILALSATALLSIFMIHQRSSFIWAAIPSLWWLQFPWRMLAICIFLLCLLIGFAVFLSGRFGYALGVILVSISFLLYFQFFTPREWLNITDKEKFSGASWEKQLTISIFDYLPIYAALPPWQKAPDLPEVLEGEVRFPDYKKGSNYQKGVVEASKDSLIRLPLFDFPGMEVKVDNQKISHRNDDCRKERYCLGLITFNVPQGKHTIKAKLRNTPIRTIGNILSLGSLLIIAVWAIKLMRYEKISL